LDVVVLGKGVEVEVSEDVAGEDVAIAVLVLELLRPMEELCELVVTPAGVDEGALLIVGALTIHKTRELWPNPVQYNNGLDLSYLLLQEVLFGTAIFPQTVERNRNRCTFVERGTITNNRAKVSMLPLTIP
jgi:hypothetical protein